MVAIWINGAQTLHQYNDPQSSSWKTKKKKQEKVKNTLAFSLLFWLRNFSSCSANLSCIDEKFHSITFENVPECLTLIEGKEG